MKSFALCFTGVSGSGKTTLANLVAEEVRRHGRRVQVIDGDILRRQLGNLFGYTREERERQSRIVRVLAKYLVDQEVNVILAIVTPYEDIRRAMRAFLGESYLEVWTDCPYEVCARRDVKGYYKLAKQNQMEHLSGANDAFEKPLNPDLILRTAEETPEQSAQRILSMLSDRGCLA